MSYALKTITVTPGVAPFTDFTPQSTPHYTLADKVRFIDGFPQKIGGWQTLLLDNYYPINGGCRAIYSYVLGNVIYYLLGTNTSLYQVQGNSIFNATPVVTDSTTLTDALGTYYGTLDNDPFTVLAGTKSIIVTDTGHPFLPGDYITFSGATGFAGIPDTDLNTTFNIGSVTTDTYTFSVATVANASTTGGGNSVVRASRVLSVAHTANGFSNGDNIVVDSVASDVGGITTSEIEGIRTIRNVMTDSYAIAVDGEATSSVSGGGGDMVIYEEIPDGNLESTTGQGYGMGYYGVGLYGVTKFSNDPTPPAIWSFDRFGNLVVMTQGNQTGLYSWASGPSALPALVSGAPTAINYVFVSDNICVTLGASNQPNRIKWCDQGNLTDWTATAQNQAGEDDIEAAGEFISHAPLRGWNLLFTKQSVYTFRYIGKPFVWETKVLDPSRGLIAQNARIVVNGIAYWMGPDNFYFYRGANVEIIPSNTVDRSTLKNYVFNDINTGQVAKIFCWYNSRFNEIWWHYPSSSSNEPDRIVRFNIVDFTWVMDTMVRTAGEYPTPLTEHPYLANYSTTGGGPFSDGFSDGFEGDSTVAPNTTVYQHEKGYDDDGTPIPWFLDTPYFTSGASTVVLGGVYQDNTLTNGSIDWTINTKLYPNQEPDSVTYTLPFDSQNLIYRRRGRYWQYRVSGATLGQYWRAGIWQEKYMQGGNK